MTQLIDLGKLRFHFAGGWDSSTVYESNDIVKYGGNVYVYTYALKTSGNLPTDTMYWALMVEGFKFQGVFDPAMAYRIGDGIAYGGKVYVSVLDSTGQTPPNTTYWSQFVDGIQYEGNYSGTVAYQKNDVVVYGGSIYIAKVDTTANDPTNTTYWNMFVEGISPKAVYNAATAYAPGDLVAYGPNLYRATRNTTGNLPTSTGFWELFVSNTRFQGTYSAATAYYLNDLVVYGNTLYRSKQDQSDVLPTGTTWELISGGVSFQGVAYNAGHTYHSGDIVGYGSNTYIALGDTVGNLPTNATYWTQYSAGFSYQGAWSSATAYTIGQTVTYGGSIFQARGDNQNVNPTTTATWNKLVAGFANRGVWATATQYGIDEVVAYGGNTFITLLPHASTDFATDLAANKWQKFNSGVRYRGTWDVATTYLKDDVVQSGSSTYICTASTTVGGTAPYLGTNANFTMLAAGAEGMVMKSGDTMTGPLVLYGDPTQAMGAATKQYSDLIPQSTFEPTGFNRSVPETMGCYEFSLDGVTVYRTDHLGASTTRTDSKFATGTAWERSATPRTFVIYPATGQSSFYVWQRGVKYSFSTLQSVSFSATGTASKQYFWVDQGVLIVLSTIDGDHIQHVPFVCEVYADESANSVVIMAEERHGITMDGATHFYLHTTSGTRYKSGLGIVGISASATTYTNTVAGELWDEDILLSIPQQSTNQMMYMQGGVWKLAPADNKYVYAPSGVAKYNQKLGPGNYTLTDVPSGSYAVMYFMATNCPIHKTIKVMGQKIFTSLALARESAQTEPRDTSLMGLPSAEFLYMGAVVVDSTGAVQTLDNGAVFVDLRLVNISAGTNSSSAVQGVASDIYFNNVGNGLTSANVQDALVEVLSKASGSWITKSSAYTAVGGDYIMADTSAAPFSVTLPAAPSNNALIRIVDATGSFDFRSLLVLRNGKTIQGRPEDLVLDVKGASVALIFSSSYGWRLI